jgi:hypothetical protein
MSSTYHSQNKLVVKSEEQREEKVGSEPCELDGTGDRVFVLKVVVLGRLDSASVALDIELALDITLSLLGGEERKRLLVIGTGRHGDGCAGDSRGCDQVPLTNVKDIVGSLAQPGVDSSNNHEPTKKSASAVDYRQNANADQGAAESLM